MLCGIDNIPWNIVSPIEHYCGYEQCYDFKYFSTMIGNCHEFLNFNQFNYAVNSPLSLSHITKQARRCEFSEPIKDVGSQYTSMYTTYTCFTEFIN